MILCIGTTPAVQRVMVFDEVRIGGVQRAKRVIEAPAGKSVNVARVLHALGRTVACTGFVGGQRGRFLQQDLDRLGIAHEFVPVEPETRMCVTVIDQTAHTHTELIEESRDVGREAWHRLHVALQHLVPRSRLVVMSGTLCPGGPVDFYARCTRLAVAAGIPCVVDATGPALLEALAAGPTVVKPNRAELSATTGLDVQDGARRLLDLGARSVVVTLGAEGAMAVDGQGMWRIRGPQVQAVNTIGSGDALAAGLAAALQDGRPIARAAALGVACGMANALTLVAGEVDAGQVRRLEQQIAVEPI